MIAPKTAKIDLYRIQLRKSRRPYFGHFFQHEGVAKPFAMQSAAILLHVSQRDQFIGRSLKPQLHIEQSFLS
jgi:hypothetical protein